MQPVVKPVVNPVWQQVVSCKRSSSVACTMNDTVRRWNRWSQTAWTEIGDDLTVLCRCTATFNTSCTQKRLFAPICRQTIHVLWFLQYRNSKQQQQSRHTRRRRQPFSWIYLTYISIKLQHARQRVPARWRALSCVALRCDTGPGVNKAYSRRRKQAKQHTHIFI